MLKEERFEIILNKLKQETTSTYEALASLISVSEDTIRRDIDYLYKNGLLSKVRGGAMLRSKDPMSFQERSSHSVTEKNIIALKAQKFIKNGMTVFMDGGTTICAIANSLPANIAIRVITNNAELLPTLRQFKNIELIFLGGIYNQDTATTTGSDTCFQASQYIADLYLMGTCAIDSELGISATFKTDAEVKKTMLSLAKQTIALVNHNKLRNTEPFKVANSDKIDVLITDLSSDNRELDEFRDMNIQLV